jgi:hypothetical protein
LILAFTRWLATAAVAVEAVAGEVAADVVVAEAAEEVAVVTGTLAATLLRCATAAGDRVAT